MGHGTLLLLSLIIISFQVAQSCSVSMLRRGQSLGGGHDCGSKATRVVHVSLSVGADFQTTQDHRVLTTRSLDRGSNRTQYSPRQVQRRNSRHLKRRRR
jgi:hypothetical protein